MTLQGYESTSDVEFEWTPTLSEYESEYESAAEDVNHGEDNSDLDEIPLHTNSPTWAALFPLPESPDISILTISHPCGESDVSLIYAQQYIIVSPCS